MKKLEPTYVQKRDVSKLSERSVINYSKRIATYKVTGIQKGIDLCDNVFLDNPKILTKNCFRYIYTVETGYDDIGYNNRMAKSRPNLYINL